MTRPDPQLQQEKRKLRQEMDELRRDKEQQMRQSQELKQELTALRSQLEDTEWGLCQKSGQSWQPAARPDPPRGHRTGSDSGTGTRHVEAGGHEEENVPSVTISYHKRHLPGHVKMIEIVHSCQYQ